MLRFLKLLKIGIKYQSIQPTHADWIFRLNKNITYAAYYDAKHYYKNRFFDIFYIQCYASVKNNIDELMFILFLGDLFRFLKEDSLINMYLLAIISL